MYSHFRYTTLALPRRTFTNTQASLAAKAESLKLKPKTVALMGIRNDSCYKTLRGMIDVIQLILFVPIGILAVSSVAMIFIPNEQLGMMLRIIAGLAVLAACAGCVILTIAAKQAALLLVDIADCQIHQIDLQIRDVQ